MRRTLVIAVLALIPSIAVAQRGGRTQADKHTPMFDKDEPFKGPTLRTRDLEDQSPIKLLIDKRKDLRLSEEQVTSLKTAEGALKDKNAPALKAVDSLLSVMKRSQDASDESRQRLRDAQGALMGRIREIHENYDQAAKPIVEKLDADTQAKAVELLNKRKEESEKTVSEKLGFGGRRG